MTLNEFNVLYAIYKEPDIPLNRLVEQLDGNLEDIKKIVTVLEEKGWLSKEVTEAGMEALSEYKVDNAIIMAAGMASRSFPLSRIVPKGLFKVKGEILIERQIEQLHQAGINEIIVVVGYLKDKFQYLKDKYGVVIVDNDDYYRFLMLLIIN